MQNDFILGNYTPYNTFIHKIDARLKLLFTIILMTAVFLSYGTYITTLIVDGILLIFIFACIFISRIKILQVIKSLKYIWITFIFVFILNILLPNSSFSTEAFNINGFVIYWEAILNAIRILFRLIMMVLLTLILTSTTKSTDLSYAFEFYFSPLKLFRFPVEILAMIISLTLRCIPLVLEESLRIKKAQESRGANFISGNIFKRIINFVSLLVPLLLTCLDRAVDMAHVMEVRGYIPNMKRSRYHRYYFSLLDLFSFIGVIAFSCFLFYLAYMQFDLLDTLFNFTNSITVLR